MAMKGIEVGKTIHTNNSESPDITSWTREKVNLIIKNKKPSIVMVKVNWIYQEIELKIDELEKIWVSLSLDSDKWEKSLLFWEKVKVNPKWDIYEYTEWSKKWQLIFTNESIRRLEPNWKKEIELLQLIQNKLIKKEQIPYNNEWLLPYIILIKVNWVNQEIELKIDELEKIWVSLNLDSDKWKESLLFWEKVKVNPEWDIYKYIEWSKKWQLIFSYEAILRLETNWTKIVELLQLIQNKI